MNSIKVIANGVYLPKTKIENDKLNSLYNLDDNWIYKRTGIQNRWYETNLNIEQMAISSVKNLLEKTNIDITKIGAIIVATTSTNKLMPGISNEIQEFLKIENCICLDILAGCSGYVNAFDIARKYIALNEVEYALVIGVELLSKYLNMDDIGTSIILGDGAGATLIGKSNVKKMYVQNIQATFKNNEILTNNTLEKIFMNGKSVYKYATTKTVENVQEIVKKSKLNMNDIKYIIPHQSNKRILDVITQKLGVSGNKVYSNILDVGNTFCASIPIALNEMFNKKLINSGDKIILLGYGGGLNLGSVLLEV